MKTKKYILYFSSLLFLTPAFAQKAQTRNDYAFQFGVNGGLVSYSGDIGPLFSNVRDWLKPDHHPSSFGGGFFLEHRIAPAIGISLNGFSGSFTANDHSYSWRNKLQSKYENFGRALNVRTELADASLSVVYHLDNGFLFHKNAKFAPFISAGVGVVGFRTYGDLYRDNSEQRYFYWSDGTIRDRDERAVPAGEGKIIAQDRKYETRLDGLKTEGKLYATKVLMIPVAIGLQYRFSDRWSANWITTAKYTFTDYLDDVSGNYIPNYDNSAQEYAANPSNWGQSMRGTASKWNDMYASTSVGISYGFGMKLRKFKGAHFYTEKEKFVPAKEEKVIVNQAVTNPVIAPNPDFVIAPAPIQMLTNTAEKPAEKVAEPSLDAKMDILNKEMEKLASTQTAGDDSLNKQILSLQKELIAVKKQKERTENASIMPVENNEELNESFRILSSRIDSLKRATTGESLPWNPNASLQQTNTNPSNSGTYILASSDKSASGSVIKEEDLKMRDAQIALLNQKVADLEKKMQKESAVVPSKEMPKSRLEKEKEALEIRRIQLENKKLKLEKKMLSQKSQQTTSPIEKSKNDAEIKQMEAELAELNTRMDSVGTAVEKVAVMSAKEPNIQVVTADDSAENLKLQAQIDLMKAEMEKMRAELKAKPTTVNAPVPPANNISNPPQNQPITINVPPAPNQDATLQRLEGKLDVIGNRLRELESRPMTNSNNTAPPVVIAPAPNPVINTEIRTQFAGMRKVSIYFGNNITEIQKQDYETLNAIVADLQNNSNMSVSIRGYASKNGKAAVNRKLSEQRANNVRNYLISKGINNNRIVLDAFGDSVSMYGNGFDRRVEVELLMQ